MLATRWLHRDVKGRWHFRAKSHEIDEVVAEIEEIEDRYRGYPDNGATRVNIALAIRELLFGQARPE